MREEMKKIFLIVALALTVSVANAWNNFAEEGVVLLASKHLSADAKSMVNQYLGESFADDVRYIYNLESKKRSEYTKEVHYLHLDNRLQPKRGEGDDALATIEQSLAVIRARSSHSKADVVKAMRTLINLMCDIHHLSNVRIDGVAHSQEDFKFLVYGGDIGKRKKTVSLKWSSLWHVYSGWHVGFSGALWAEDMELCLGAHRAQLSKGSLQDWVAQIGATSLKMYSKINPEYVMTRRERNELEVLNYEMMARAGYRLAVLFNESAK